MNNVSFRPTHYAKSTRPSNSGVGLLIFLNKNTTVIVISVIEPLEVKTRLL